MAARRQASRAPLPTAHRPAPNPQGGPTKGGGWTPTWQPTWKPGAQGGPTKGGGKGGGKKGGGKGGATKRPDLVGRATNDVQVSFQPQLDAIKQAQLAAQQQYADDAARVQNIYGALLNQLGPLSGTYDTAAQGIAGDLSSQIGGLAGLLGSSVEGVPASEITAGTNAVGTQGTGALESLAVDRSRNLDYNTSAQRQGGIEQMTASRNYLMDLQDLMDQYAQQGLDITAQMPALIRSRLGELRDQRWQRKMAQKEFGLRAALAKAQLNGDKATANWIKKQINANRSGPGNGGGGGGNWSPGPGGGGAGGGAQAHPGGDGSGGAALNHLLSGGSRWNDLTPAQRTAVASKWTDPAAVQEVEAAWMRTFLGGRIRITSQQQFIDALKKIAEAARAGGGGAGGGGATQDPRQTGGI